MGLHTKGEFISYELGQWNFQFLNGLSPNGCQESNSTQFVRMEFLLETLNFLMYI